MSSRRNLLKAVLGFQGTVLTGTVFRRNAGAARRGTSGPDFSTMSGNVGYTFEIRANRDDILSVVALPGRGPTDFSVTILNRTPYALDVEIFLLDELVQVLRDFGHDTMFIILQAPGLYQFRVMRGEFSPLNWEARIPGPS